MRPENDRVIAALNILFPDVNRVSTKKRDLVRITRALRVAKCREKEAAEISDRRLGSFLTSSISHRERRRCNTRPD